MKLTKRIFAVILLMALAIFCFAIASSAEFTAENIEDILEYYQNPDYVIDDFEDYAVGDSYIFNVVNDDVAAAFPRPETDDNLNLVIDESTGLVTMGSLTGVSSVIAADPTDANGKVLSVTRTSGTGPLNYIMEMSESSRNLLATMRIYVDKNTAKRASTFTISFTNNSLPESVTALQLDFYNAVIKYPAYTLINGSTDLQSASSYSLEMKTVEGVTLETGKWYSIDLVFNGSTGSYTFSVTPDGGTAVTSETVNGGALSSGACMYIDSAIVSFNATSQTRGNINYVDDIAIYNGTFFRDPANKNAVTSEAMVNLAALRAGEIDFDTQFRIAKVYDAIISGGYVPAEDIEGADIAALTALLSDAEQFMNKTYISAVCNAASAINTTQSYSKRVAQLELVNMYLTYLPATDTEIEALPGFVSGDLERIAAAKVLLETERQNLEDIKADSEAFNALMASYDAESRDYYYICGIYDDAMALDKRNTSYDGVFANEQVFSAIKEKRDSVVYNVTTFRESVLKMQDPDAGFGVVYTSYLAATEVYNGGLIHPDIDLDNIDGIYDDIAAYVAGEDDIKTRIRESEEFITMVNRAASATYYSSIKLETDNAAIYLDADKENKNAELEYAGMSEAKALYDSLLLSLAKMEKSADAYIAAVSELEDLVRGGATYAEKKNAVASAKELSEDGNVLGYEGVKEANIALAKIEADIKLAEGYSKTLVETVAELKVAKTLAERRELILRAKSCVGSCEKTYSGVSAAITELNAAIAQYKADVVLVMSALNGATANAGAISSAVVNTSELY